MGCESTSLSECTCTSVGIAGITLVMRTWPARLKSWLPSIGAQGLCVVLGWFAWRVFGGGLIGSDGEWQVHQALAGQINDWLSPAMTAVLRQGLYHFYALAPIVLIQSIVLCIGLFHLTRGMVRLQASLSPFAEATLALGLVLLLMVPPSPLIYFLAYVQNDSWLLAGLVYSMAGWLNLAATHDSRLMRGAWWASAIGGAAWMILMRHNAIVVLPVFILLAIHAGRGTSRSLIFAVALVTALLPIAVGKWLNHHFKVQPIHPEDQILALDLVGLCVEREDLRADLPYTNRHLIDEHYRQRYIPGFVNIYYFYSPTESRPTLLEFTGEPEGAAQRLGSRHAELAADYRQALQHAPFTLMQVKLKAFRAYLTDVHVAHWHATSTLPPTYGATPAKNETVQEFLATMDETVQASPTLRLFFASHIPWLTLCLVGIAISARRVVSSPDARYRFLLLLVPTTYYASHLVAVAGHWYRYMYPATLLIQMEMLLLFGLALVHTGKRFRVLMATAKTDVQR